MRLTPDQAKMILCAARDILGEHVRISIYGSRLDDARKGGDLDILLESATQIPVLVRAEFKIAVERKLQIPVDILVYQIGTTPSAFQSIALSQSRPLETAA